MHMVPFMENTTEIGVSEGQLESMISCLLEHGASLQALADRNLRMRKYAFDGETPLDSAFKRLHDVCDTVPKSGDEHRKITALQTVKLFINMGARWLPLSSDDIDMVTGWDENRHRILSHCLNSAVLLLESKYAGDGDLWNSDFDSNWYRSVRKLWAQIAKNLIRKATEALSLAADSTNKRAVQEMLHDAFCDLVHQVDSTWQREGTVGWWALEALGKLLLSTGIKPSGTTRRAWERILNRDYEAPEPGRKVKLIKDCEDLDGGKREWAFLSEPVTFAKIEAA